MRSGFIFLLLATLVLAGPLRAQKDPDQFFGVRVGGDRVLVAYPQIVQYFRHLEQTSARVKVSEEGRSTLGNPLILAAISSEENIRNLPRLQEINRRLARVEGIGADEAAALAGQARVFVLITAGIHATEIGASQMAPLLAHRLATADDAATREILSQAVVLLMPSINPDGQIMVCDWYRRMLGTPYEGGSMPWLYHPYAGHDNNRDYFMLNLEESRAVNAVLHGRWYPQIFLDMHQMGGEGPRIFVPPFQDPFNQNLSPLMLREVELLGAAMALRLQREGKSGVANSYGFDAYWPGGTKNTAWYKNVVGLLTELASCRIATPVYVDPSELRGGGKGLPEYKPQVNFPDPWRGGWWRLSDIIDYELGAAMALIETAARHRGMFVESFLAMGRENIRSGGEKAPYAYILPRRQWDEPEAGLLAAKMAEHGVCVERLTADWTAGGRIHEKGSYVIRLAQPYRPFIQVMLERQRYPEIRFNPGGPIMEPYDTTGWTLPLLMNVKAEALDLPLTGAPLEAASTEEFTLASLKGSGDAVLLPGRFNQSYLAVNRLLAGGVPVRRLLADAGELRSGDFLVAAAGRERALDSALAGTGVPARRIAAAGLKAAELRPPRIAVYQSYLPSADEGWTRWVLERYGFACRPVRNADLADPAFPEKTDVLIFPSQGRSVIVDGRYPERGDGSERSERPAPWLPREYQGGIGKAGIEAAKALVARGGRLILLDAAWEIARRDFELPISPVAAGGDRAKFNCPGSILAVQLEAADPLAWGLERDAALFFSNSAAFRCPAPEDQRIRRHVVGRFAASGPHLLSGYLLGGDLLDNAVVAVRYEFARGQVVVLGGRVQFRGQSTGTFKLLFNALLL